MYVFYLLSPTVALQSEAKTQCS